MNPEQFNLDRFSASDLLFFYQQILKELKDRPSPERLAAITTALDDPKLMLVVQKITRQTNDLNSLAELLATVRQITRLAAERSVDRKQVSQAFYRWGPGLGVGLITGGIIGATSATIVMPIALLAMIASGLSIGTIGMNAGQRLGIEATRYEQLNESAKAFAGPLEAKLFGADAGGGKK